MQTVQEKINSLDISPFNTIKTLIKVDMQIILFIYRACTICEKNKDQKDHFIENIN